MLLFHTLFNNIHLIATHAAPGMPPDYWWVTATIFGLLGLAATVDAFTETVPDSLILLGIIAVVITQGFYSGWPTAIIHFRSALFAGLIIWFINYFWHQIFHYDALGMGDAKWTMLAVACFGTKPALYAWGIGSILAVITILSARPFRYRITQVTFAPFLFIGLCSGLYWLRFASI